MRYTGTTDYKHDSPPCTGVLLLNLGTPDAPGTAAVRRYLAEFLSDPRVIEMPSWIWQPLLHGIILRVRPRRSARLYRKIWTEQGSPLLEISRRQAAAIQLQLAAQVAGDVHVELGMRYGNPSISAALERLRGANARRLLVFPLYPQYSATTTASSFDAVADVLRTWRWLPELRLINHYHDEPAYIGAVADSIRAHWARGQRAERLLFSFHGLPRKYFLAGDPYFCECQKTARLVAERLQLADADWALSFQSRLGAGAWLQPYTDLTLKQWGRDGVRSVDVVCPGFAADCLETLEEIRQQNRDFYLQAGGGRYAYIDALNDSPEHISLLTDLILRHCAGWPEFDPARDAAAAREQLSASAARAARLQQD